KPHFDPFLLRLLEFEGHARYRELAALERPRIDLPGFRAALVRLQFLVSFRLAPSAHERLRHQITWPRVQMIRVHRQPCLERRDCGVPLLQTHSGPPKLE